MFIVLVIVIRQRHMEDWDLDHILENWKGFQTLFENLKSIQKWLRYYCLKMMLNEGKTFKGGELSIWTPSNRSGMIKSGVWYIFWDVWRPYSRKNRISYPPGPWADMLEIGKMHVIPQSKNLGAKSCGNDEIWIGASQNMELGCVVGIFWSANFFYF